MTIPEAAMGTDPLDALGLGIDTTENTNHADFSTRGEPPKKRKAAQQSGPMDPTEVALRIVEDCKLESLKNSVCLSCARRVMVQGEGQTVTLFCSALHRDLELSVSLCSSWTEQKSTPDGLDF